MHANEAYDILEADFDEFTQEKRDIFSCGIHNSVDVAYNVTNFVKARKKFWQFICAARDLGFDKDNVIPILLTRLIEDAVPCLTTEAAYRVAQKEYADYMHEWHEDECEKAENGEFIKELNERYGDCHA